MIGLGREGACMRTARLLQLSPAVAALPPPARVLRQPALNSRALPCSLHILPIYHAGWVFASAQPCGGGPCLQPPTIQATIAEAALKRGKAIVMPGEGLCGAIGRASSRAWAPLNTLPPPPAAGVYSGPGNVNLTFPSAANIQLLALAGPEGTTIDCQGAGRAFVFAATDGAVEVTGVWFGLQPMLAGP